MLHVCMEEHGDIKKAYLDGLVQERHNSIVICPALHLHVYYISRVSCQKGPICHA